MGQNPIPVLKPGYRHPFNHSLLPLTGKTIPRSAAGKDRLSAVRERRPLKLDPNC